MLVINPLWKTEGNLVSEFGLLPWDRKKNEVRHVWVCTAALLTALLTVLINVLRSLELVHGAPGLYSCRPSPTQDFVATFTRSYTLLEQVRVRSPHPAAPSCVIPVALHRSSHLLSCVSLCGLACVVTATPYVPLLCPCPPAHRCSLLCRQPCYRLALCQVSVNHTSFHATFLQATMLCEHADDHASTHC